jgi:hypothetical protein
VRFGLSLSAIVVAALASTHAAEPLLYAERTFFGVYRVTNRPGEYRTLMHGTTLHGMEPRSGPEKGSPVTYFHPAGPYGQAFAAVPAASGDRIGVVGLGIGALAAYAEPAQQWTFYEIDPAVERIARMGEHFTFLERCGDRCRVVIGDARLSLARTTETYDVLVLDAFTSDAIPMHLMTHEAFGLYLSRLKPGGALVVHISNRHLSLSPLVAGLAESHGLVGVVNFDRHQPDWPETRNEMILAVLARTAGDLGGLATDHRWQRLTASTSIQPWTDDFSNILSVIGRP